MKSKYYLILLISAALLSIYTKGQNTIKADQSWSYVGLPDFSVGPAICNSLAFDPSGQPYIAFCDQIHSWKATVMKFNGSDWVYLGMPGFSAGGVFSTHLAFRPSGEPYVCYYDSTYAGYSVMKFNGINWINVGIPGFSSGPAYGCSISIGADSVPYVAYEDGSQSNKATVVKFDGNSWITVGNQGFSLGAALNLTLALDQDCVPYVAFNDASNANIGMVMKFDGSNWVYVGASGFSEGWATDLSLAFSLTGQPYVVYSDWGSWYCGMAFVRKFDGTNWIPVGNWLSQLSCNNNTIAFNPTGELFVSYTTGIIAVVTYDGTNWVNVGQPNFTVTPTTYSTFALSPVGEPYVAFSDWSSYKASVMYYDSVYTATNEKSMLTYSCYPNPASKFFIIEFKNLTNEPKIIRIYDVKGGNVAEVQTHENKVIISVEDFLKGIYITKINIENSVYTYKFYKD